MALFVVAAPALAQLGLPSSGEGKPAVTARLVASVKSARPGETFTVGVLFNVPRGTYFYYRSPGQTGLATKVSFAAPPGYAVGPVQFPGPEVKEVVLGSKLTNSYVYKRSTAVTAEVKVPADAKPGDVVEVVADFRFQYCEENGVCVPPRPTKEKITLPIVAGDEAIASADAAALQRARTSIPVAASNAKYIALSAELASKTLSPGQKTELLVNVQVEPGFKLQMHNPPAQGLVSTDVIVENPTGVSFGPPVYPAPLAPKKVVEGYENVKEYRDSFTINVPIAATDRLTGSKVEIGGLLRYQACNLEGSCFPPIFASFAVTAPVEGIANAAGTTEPTVASDTSQPESPPQSSPIADGTGAKALEGMSEKVASLFNNIVLPEESGSLGQYLVFAFLGGLILNVMPCVLPVIAIKVISFVQQSGQNRGRILLLNLAYSAGVVFVFLVLATLAVGFGFGWGSLFQQAEFNLFMAGLVFAMGLSLLGVFEIPVPGFAGSMSGGDHQEGPLGAFLTGILATLLATPCSGPFLGVTLAWSVRQPVEITYLVWAAMGIGMASPYVVFGLFPAATRWLPKPGNWMVTFKEIAGFFLMATVVYIMWTLNETYILPVLVVLLGIAVGSWMIGNLYDINTPPLRKNFLRFAALAISVGICGFGVTTVKGWVEDRRDFRIAKAQQEWMESYVKKGVSFPDDAAEAEKDENKLPWQPFNEERLAKLVSEGTTVLVDFSADWCLTCKANERNALDTEKTRDWVKKNGVVTMYADYTEFSEGIQRWLNRFESVSVPLTVIFPGQDPFHPVIIRDAYFQQALLAALKKAGPSKNLIEAPGEQVTVTP